MSAPERMRLAERLRHWSTNLISLIIVGLLRQWHMTWRWDRSDLAAMDGLLEHDDRLLFVFWHGKYFPLFTLLEGRRILVLTAGSFRGEVIAKICRRFGYEARELPRVKNGSAYPVVKELLAESQNGAMALDGSAGPYHRVKSGAIRLASELGFALVPVSVASSPNWTMASRWDKRELPHYFARIALATGEPIYVPADLDDAAMRDWENRLREVMEALDRDVAGRLKN